VEESIFNFFLNHLKNLRSLKTASAVNNSTASIFFLRHQRRYNKRRYSRVRATSRAPFFAGMSFSAILAGMFWGGAHKSVD